MPAQLPRRAAVALLALIPALAAPTANAAPTTLNGRADVGPVLVGDSVIWGQDGADGAGTILQDGKPLASFAKPDPGVDGRSFGSVAGSPTSVAYTVVDYSLQDAEANSQVDVTTATPLLSTAGGAFANPLGTCQAQSIATAVQGDTVAFALNSPATGCRNGIYVNGRKIAAADYVTELRLAGPYVAWLTAGPSVGNVSGSITVAAAATGKTLATFPISGTPWGGFDIDAAGNIVAEHSEHLLAFTVKKAKRRMLSRDSGSVLATAGGRVAYVAYSKAHRYGVLTLADLKGRTLSHLDSFGPRHYPVGGIALSDTRIAWGVRQGGKSDGSYAYSVPGVISTEALSSVG